MFVVVLSRYLFLVVEIMIILSGMFMYLRYNIYKEEEKRFEQNNYLTKFSRGDEYFGPTNILGRQFFGPFNLDHCLSASNKKHSQ